MSKQDKTGSHAAAKSRYCSAHTMTFGGKCIACGFDPNREDNMHQKPEATHTPGPWEAIKATAKGEYYIEEMNQRAIVATVHVCCGWEHSNARLIAAALELLTACTDKELDAAHDRLSALLEDGDAGNDDIRDAAVSLCACLVSHAHNREQAVKKATGRV